MKINYTEELMWRVYYFNDKNELKTALFEDKEAAEHFAANYGNTYLNKYTWHVKIEDEA